MKNKTLTMKWNLFKTGISTDRFTPLSAMLMGASVLLYGTIQVGLNQGCGALQSYHAAYTPWLPGADMAL